MPHVTDATVLFGDHDLIVKLEANDLATIAKAVVKHIRSVDGVVNTKTLAGADLDCPTKTVALSRRFKKSTLGMGY